jgi:formiminotetrahydrofolate cyclodeaminase
MTAGTRAAGTAATGPIRTQTVDQFLDALADGTPTPAGGAACAVVAATAAGLAGMVARVIARRSADARWTSLATSADELRRTTLGLADRDAEAYRRVIEARRARAARARGVDASEGTIVPDVADALREATDVPLAVARAGSDLLSLCRELAGAVPAAMASDVSVAIALARAALEGSITTARSNVAGLERDIAVAVERQLADLEQQHR